MSSTDGTVYTFYKVFLFDKKNLKEYSKIFVKIDKRVPGTPG